ncbi:MAG: 4-aminobutyrate--2-oxoglutarate transaminase [Actinomycetota bacterium]
MPGIAYRLPQERRLAGDLPGPRSAALHERRRAAVSAAVASSSPFYAVDADGGVLIDADGNSVVDLGSGIAVTTVGASAPRVAAAIREAAGHFTHTCFMVTPYEGYVAVCERLNGVAPGTGSKKSALFNSGAEAVENAVKVARKATRRPAIAAFEHAYHGRTNLTLALTSRSMPYKSGMGPFAPEVYRVPMSYPFRDPAGMTGEEAAARAIAVMEKQVGADNLAAVVIEPIQGEGGFIVPASGFLPSLARWCRENGVVLIADEIQSGLCRTGRWFAGDWEDLEPDLVTTAKALAAGMPLAALTGRADLLDAIHPGGLGGTYGGNPICCAAALAALDTMEEWDLCGRAEWIEQVIREIAGPLASGSDHVGELRGRGAMMALEFVRPGGTDPDPATATAVQRACLARGVVVLACGTYGNVVRLLPPLVIPEDLLRQGLAVLAEEVMAL